MGCVYCDAVRGNRERDAMRDGRNSRALWQKGGRGEGTANRNWEGENQHKRTARSNGERARTVGPCPASVVVLCRWMPPLVSVSAFPPPLERCARRTTSMQAHGTVGREHSNNGQRERERTKPPRGTASASQHAASDSSRWLGQARRQQDAAEESGRLWAQRGTAGAQCALFSPPCRCAFLPICCASNCVLRLVCFSFRRGPRAVRSVHNGPAPRPLPGNAADWDSRNETPQQRRSPAKGQREGRPLAAAHEQGQTTIGSKYGARGLVTCHWHGLSLRGRRAKGKRSQPRGRRSIERKAQGNCKQDDGMCDWQWTEK
jgi:hypothetical protein